MFRLAICEDDRIFIDTLNETCHSILKKRNFEYEISMFTNSTEFLAAYITQQQRFDMILLDIVIDNINGIELARRIRKIDENNEIVFITSYDKYALQGYDVKALHYLMKPPDSKLLEKLIESTYEKLTDKTITIKAGAQHIRVPISEIVSLEIMGRRVEISLMEGVVYYSGKLTDILSELPKGMFVQCHKAYAVNISNIREITNRNAIAVNGKEIPVSRTFWNDMKTAFFAKLDAD